MPRSARGLDAALPADVAPFRPRPLAVLPHDRVRGGLLGRSFWGWLVIELLWVDPSLRGAGYGRRLITTAEQEGRRRGCRRDRADTYSFRAPGFYQRCGYARFAALDDFPAGNTHCLYAKDLLPGSPPTGCDYHRS